MPDLGFLWQRAKNWLPRGTALPDEVWAQRHRWILGLLWSHVPVIFVFGVARGESAQHALAESGMVALFGVAARTVRSNRRRSTIVTAVGLLTCSAVLVHLSGGTIEMHFHYFVMVGVIALYQDWWPFLIAIGYVVLQHGLGAAVDASAVYDHHAAVEHPWKWAGLHGLFILGMSIVSMASWRLNEAFLAGVLERQDQLSEAQAVARLGSWEHDGVESRSTWSPEFFRLIGADPAMTEPRIGAFLPFVHPDDRGAVEAGIDLTVNEGIPLAIDFRVLVAANEGDVRWLHGRALRTMVGGVPVGLSGTVQDITERKRAENGLQETLSLLGATLDATADGLLVVDKAGRITSHNNQFVEMWRIPADIVASADDETLLAYTLGQVANPSGFLVKVREGYDHPDVSTKDTVEFLDGRIFERRSTPQRIASVTVGRVWSFRDITEQKRLENELAHQAFHDSLTNLANRALFRDRVEHALRRGSRKDQTIAVLFLDLDNFKRVNDSLGHTAGDDLLVEVAERLRGCLRVTDTAARLGGDEFAILLEDLGADSEAEALATRVVEAMQLPFAGGEREVFIGASIGIAFPTREMSGDQLLSEADLAMYAAKHRGKGRWETYRADMHLAVIDRLELESDLRRGLARDELVVHYQPIVSLTSSVITGVEALVRWHHPTRGWMLPDSFIPLAEESGLVTELGRQVLMAACAQVRAWQVAYPTTAASLSVSVNVSPRQLQGDTLISHVRDALAASGLDPSNLVLEITETAMMEDADTTIEKLNALKRLGVQLAIDDFGTGYSSLSYLQRFPVDLLKIDRAFVSTLASDGNDHGSLASTIVSLAKALRMRAVAEGVETESQAAALTGLGCELAQGYLFARPADAETIGQLLAKGAVVSSMVPL